MAMRVRRFVAVLDVEIDDTEWTLPGMAGALCDSIHHWLNQHGCAEETLRNNAYAVNARRVVSTTSAITAAMQSDITDW